MTKTRKQSKANCVRSSQQTVEEKSGSSMFGDTTKGPKFVQLHSAIFKDNRLSVGGQVKAKGEVLKYHSSSQTKALNLTCRIESFGRICQKFDDKRKKWVGEMGFGGLLFLASGMHLPRQLAYWLLSRIDPLKKMLICFDGTEFKLSQNQVYWIFGIPNGGKVVPSKSRMNDHVKGDVEKLLRKYGQSWETKCTKGRVYNVKGILVNSAVMDRVEGDWEDKDEVEFKTLFLLLSLHMVLCPTQSPRISPDMLPALTCAKDCAEYDWCGLVISKFISSVTSFARKFYSRGHAAGSGGCLLFIVVLYLDRLNADPIRWGAFPRVSVWGNNAMSKAARQDRVYRHGCFGDFGAAGMLDVAYGERHPLDARDSNGPPDSYSNTQIDELPIVIPSPKPRRRRATKGDGESWFKSN